MWDNTWGINVFLSAQSQMRILTNRKTWISPVTNGDVPENEIPSGNLSHSY